MSETEDFEALRDYAAGRLGTREAIERLGLVDYADLLIALARHELPLPYPSDTPSRRAHRAKAQAILMPRLLHVA